MFLFSVWFIRFHTVTQHKAFFSVASHSHITHPLIKCFTVSLLRPSIALEHRTACWEICSVLLWLMFRIARFSHTVSAIQIMYAVHAYYANVCVEYLDGMQHLPKCAVFDHSTHNALCLTFLFQRDKWMGSKTRCIWIIFINIKIYIYSWGEYIYFKTLLRKPDQKSKNDNEFIWWQFNILLKFSHTHSFKSYKPCTVLYSEHSHLAKHLMDLQCPLGDVGTREVHVWTPDTMRLLYVPGHL